MPARRPDGRYAARVYWTVDGKQHVKNLGTWKTWEIAKRKEDEWRQGQACNTTSAESDESTSVPGTDRSTGGRTPTL